MDFGVRNFLGPALSLSKGNYKNEEVKIENNTQFKEKPLLNKS